MLGASRNMSGSLNISPSFSVFGGGGEGLMAKWKGYESPLCFHSNSAI